MSLTPENTITQLRLTSEIITPASNIHSTESQIEPLDGLSNSDSEHSLMRLDASETDYSDDEISSKPARNRFTQLVEEIKKVLGSSSGIDAADVDTESLMDTLRQYKSQRSDWQKYAFENYEVPYTRNGVDTINSKANLLVLVWTPGKGSAVHDHANAHCMVKVLQGSLRETLYDTPTNDDHDLHVSKVTDVGVNDVTYMSDTLGLHRMENVGSIPAVSLHLYTPPWAAKYGCNVYEKDASKHHVSMSTLYSDKGVRIGAGANTC